MKEGQKDALANCAMLVTSMAGAWFFFGDSLKRFLAFFAVYIIMRLTYWLDGLSSKEEREEQERKELEKIKEEIKRRGR